MRGTLCQHFDHNEAESQDHTSDGYTAPDEVAPSFSSPIILIQAYKAEA